MMRDLRIGDVDVVGGRYTPKKRKLHVFTSVDVTVKFGGASTGKFGDTEDFNDPWNVFFNRNYSRLIVNDTAVSANLGDIKVNPQAFCGEEMLVITSPALEPAADTFANARRAAGINTRVALTGAGAGAAGTTNTEIQAFIRNHLTTEQCKLHPSYVVLIGNTAHVPSFLVECSPGAGFFPNPDKPDDYCDIGSDLPYSLNGVGTDLFADVELGRIPAPDLATANTVVNKIINYENSDPAPAGDDFYHHATVTGFFQQRVHCVLNEGSVGPQNCNENIGGVNGHYEPDYANHTDERGFTKTSDSIIRAIQFNGYSVDRLWTTDPQSTPEFYYDGTPIPDNLRRPAFAWDSDTTDFLNAYNGGRFLILHRDHGWPNGWADPTLSSGDVPSMTNGTKLPVVMGINCASALFDNPADPSFVEEQIEKADGGAVAGFGDTRVSPTWPNNWMALGFTDAFFPNTVPDFGSDEPTRKLGDVLLSGKNYMAEGNSGGGEYVEHYLYHLLGDPSMQMWAAAPYHFDPGKLQVNFEAVPKPGPGDPPYHVFVQMPLGAGELPPAGTVATLRSAGAPIGRAIVGADGKATITPEVNSSRRLEVSFEQQGALPVADTVDGAP
jgi:hypothetical protein